MIERIDWSKRRDRCPSCGRDGESGLRGTLSIHRAASGPLAGRLVAHCHRLPCGFFAIQGGAEHHATTPQAAPPAATVHEVLSDYGRELWRETRALAGEALAYLQARECPIPPQGSHLRWRPALKHPPSGQAGPALVALVTDALTREPLTLHRTWVQADGTKAAVSPPRMLLGRHRKAGGVIRLWPDDSVTLGLSIAEGIESALSLAHAGGPVWAAIDAGNLAAFPVLGGVEVLTIGADHDEAGIAAAHACADRWVTAGREVRIVMAPTPRADINDIAKAA